MPDADASPQRQRVAAYAVITRLGPEGPEILLSKLAPYLTPSEQWTLPGGGIDFGEDPRDAVVREVYEETGLQATVSDRALIDSVRNFASISKRDMHSVRIVYDGWVPADSPPPRVVEVNGSTVDARWHLLADVRQGRVNVVRLVVNVLAVHATVQHQRLAAYALIRRDDAILLTRISGTGAHPGAWTLPGGGVDHGESPAVGLVREVSEETGLTATVGALLGVHDSHFTGTAPSGRTEDFHGVHLVFAATASGEPRVIEEGGTTDRVAWVPLAELDALDTLDVVQFALGFQA